MLEKRGKRNTKKMLEKKEEILGNITNREKRNYQKILRKEREKEILDILGKRERVNTKKYLEKEKNKKYSGKYIQ